MSGRQVETGTKKLLGVYEHPVGWLVFNNPERRNAISLDMSAAIPKVIEAFEADPDIRAVVLKGAGGRAFVSGADISEFDSQRADAAADVRYSRQTRLGNAAVAEIGKPTIAMIEGYCLGGGMAMALSCDLRICAEGSRFGIPAARLGIGYRYSGLAALTALVGPSYAKEILFTARHLDAEEALRIGLVNKVVPAHQLEATVRDYVRMIAENAPLTIQAAKLAIDAAIEDPMDRDMAVVEAATERCFNSQDFAEGRRAFLEKRKPVFQGR